MDKVEAGEMMAKSKRNNINELIELLREQQRLVLQTMAQSTWVQRDVLGQCRAHLKTPLVKVITGPRRAGKSVLSFQLVKDTKFAYVNFDDDNLVRYLKLNGTSDILPALEQTYGEFEYLVFDEIQNVDSWELFVSRLYNQKINLIITGSNSKLLSSELASHLTGRHLVIPLLPFSFHEFSQLAPQVTLTDYLLLGGFPDIATHFARSQQDIRPTRLFAENYLDALLDSILLKDVVRRYKIRNPAAISSIFGGMLASLAKEFSVAKITNSLHLSSKTTTQKYLGYINESYLLLLLPRFSFKLKEQLAANRKCYLIDTGFGLLDTTTQDNVSRKLENLVLLELLRRGLRIGVEIFYYRTKSNREVDFIVKDKQRITSAIQVCYSIKDHATRERELSALGEAAGELRPNEMFVVTWEEEQKIEIEGQRVDSLSLDSFLHTASF